jgi:cobalt-zinc-cadmium efflux system membrane fusion protein
MRAIGFLLCLALTLAACSREIGHGAHGHDEGPHGGRWLEHGDLALEVTIFERGVPPEFRVYAFDDGKPVPPSKVEVELELLRFGGEVERFTFEAREDHLLGVGVVGEPHSFDVTVRADYAGKRHEWSYESHEGRTTIVAEMVSRSAPSGGCT